MESSKAAVLVAKILCCCHGLMGSNEAVKQLWVQSELDWLSLGIKGEDLVEFLEDHVGLCLIGGGGGLPGRGCDGCG